MTQEQWTAVDDYIAELFVPPDPALEAALQASATAGLPPIQVAPNQGKLLMLLAAEPRVSATVIQTVGSKGYDGLAIALVTE